MLKCISIPVSQHTNDTTDKFIERDLPDSFGLEGNGCLFVWKMYCTSGLNGGVSALTPNCWHGHKYMSMLLLYNFSEPFQLITSCVLIQVVMRHWALIPNWIALYLVSTFICKELPDWTKWFWFQSINFPSRYQFYIFLRHFC